MRLFVAAELSSPQTALLSAKVNEARLAAPFEAIRWLPPENWHGTLAFIGDQDEADIASIVDTIDPVIHGARSLEYSPHRIQAMPHRSMPRLFALKTAAGQGLQELYFHLHNALKIKDRKHHFQFHITVARFKEVRGNDARILMDAIKDLSGFDGEVWTVPRVTLFESVLGQSGATYRPMLSWQTDNSVADL